MEEKNRPRYCFVPPGLHLAFRVLVNPPDGTSGAFRATSFRESSSSPNTRRPCTATRSTEALPPPRPGPGARGLGDAQLEVRDVPRAPGDVRPVPPVGHDDLVPRSNVGGTRRSRFAAISYLMIAYSLPSAGWTNSDSKSNWARACATSPRRRSRAGGRPPCRRSRDPPGRRSNAPGRPADL